jgi:hypothetical protein
MTGGSAAMRDALAGRRGLYDWAGLEADAQSAGGQAQDPTDLAGSLRQPKTSSTLQLGLVRTNHHRALAQFGVPQAGYEPLGCRE